MCPWFNSKRYHFLLSFDPVPVFMRGRIFLFLAFSCFFCTVGQLPFACAVDGAGPWYPSRDGRRHMCTTVAVQSYGGRRTGNTGMPSWRNAVVRHLFAEGTETCKKVNIFDKNIISFMGKGLLFTRIPIFRYCVAVMFFLSLQTN